MRHRLTPLLLLPLILASCSHAPVPIKAVSHPPAPRFPAEIYVFRGTPQQIGQQHGEALGSTIRAIYSPYFERFFSSTAVRLLATANARGFEARMLPEHREEITALGAAAQMQHSEIMLGQCFLDLTPITACSTITLPADASPDGIARFGRNLDFPSFNVADKHSVLLIFHPAPAADGTPRHSFAAVTWPGLAGVLTGMNEHGLTLANMEVRRKGSSPIAMPYTLLYRTVLERCTTVEEAIALLQSTPRQTPNTLMLMDAAGNRAVVELSPQKVDVRRGDAGSALISTNHHRDQDQATPGRCRRYDSLRSTSDAGFGQITEKHIENMLADVAQGDMTLQSMVFEPSNRVIYLSTGKAAHNKPFVRLDLSPYFAAK